MVQISHKCEYTLKKKNNRKIKRKNIAHMPIDDRVVISFLYGVQNVVSPPGSE